jgi:hypothetical protein
MKTALFALILLSLLCTASAFAQTAALLPSQPQILHMTDHPMHAEIMPLATEHSLIGGGPSTYSWAQGERPVWEFGPVSDAPRPLGDIAREYRKEKQTSRKAEVVLEKQGS